MTQNPSAGKTLTRKQGVALFNGIGNTVITQLQRSNLYRGIGLRLNVQPTVAGASNTVANTAKGDEWGCVTRIRVVVNGTDALFDMTGDDLVMFNRAIFGTKVRIQPTLGDGATANPAIDSTLWIPFWALRGRKPMDTALESWNYGSLQVEITFDSWVKINTAATAYSANPQIEIYCDELTPAFQADGKTLKFRPAFYARTIRQVQDYAVAQTQGKFILDAAPFHKGFLLNVQANGGGNDLINTLTNIKLFDGPRLVCDYGALAALSFGELSLGLDPGLEIDSTNIVRNTRLRVSQSSDPRAWYYVPVTKDGMLSEAIGGMNTGDLYFELQSSAAFRLIVIDQQVIANPFL